MKKIIGLIITVTITGCQTTSTKKYMGEKEAINLGLHHALIDSCRRNYYISQTQVENYGAAYNKELKNWGNRRLETMTRAYHHYVNGVPTPSQCESLTVISRRYTLPVKPVQQVVKRENKGSWRYYETKPVMINTYTPTIHSAPSVYSPNNGSGSTSRMLGGGVGNMRLETCRTQSTGIQICH
ncbi:hypothetical protein [Moritella marina]|uniref:hypothetical protein n=1 Tax=Moritella marina TaxID=90736 RepID=UPI003704A6F1